MNKSSLLLLVIIGITFTQQSAVDEVYKTIVSFVKGLSNDELATCPAVLVYKKQKIFEVIDIVIGDITKFKPIKEILQNFLLNLMKIDGVVEECHIMEIPLVYNKLFTEEGKNSLIKNINKNIVLRLGYKTKIYEEIKNKDYRGIAQTFGQMLSAFLDFKMKL